uniref:Uncharacterized protein n=1 Tax=Utricularia reniformis TaxID=192314 RepID=A0A1Y0B1V9_9LAMI|nr:hypothetical protein AEK19_MT1137 [Utricularia reniformis]ART31353.1 hypothetical protein AEK19_MT1137 [Utricularia reniformis]
MGSGPDSQVSFLRGNHRALMCALDRVIDVAKGCVPERLLGLGIPHRAFKGQSK